MRTITICTLLMVLAACAHGGRSSSPTTVPPGGAIAQMVTASSGHLLVTAQIDGRRYTMIVDTGASITALSSRASRQLGLARTGSMRINDHAAIPTARVRSLSIAGVVHEDVSVAIIDLADAAAVGADGVLGLDVLGRHDIVVDLAGGEMGVWPVGTVARRSQRDGIALEYGANGLIMLDVELSNRTRVPAMLDLGAPTSTLNRPAGALIGARVLATTVARAGDTTLGPVQVVVNDLRTFARLGLQHRPAMLLGSDAFEDRVLGFSYRDRVAFVSR